MQVNTALRSAILDGSEAGKGMARIAMECGVSYQHINRCAKEMNVAFPRVRRRYIEEGDAAAYRIFMCTECGVDVCGGRERNDLCSNCWGLHIKNTLSSRGT